MRAFRFRARSLRVRLLLGGAVAIFIALAAAWFAMTLLFERHVERRVERDLVREGLQLAAALRVAADGAPTLERLPGDARYNEPASGLYWQVSTPAGAVRSRSLWDAALPPAKNPSAARWTARLERGPFEQRVLIVERLVQPDPDDPYALVQLAQELESVHQARAEFGGELAAFLALLWAILAAAAWLQVHLGLRPLARVRADMDAMQSNPHARLSASHAREVEPLVRAINDLADARERDLERARRRAADLAHALKTPLAALAAESRRAREAGASEAADGLERALSAVATVVETELSRSRAAAARSGLGAQCEPAPLIEAVVDVIERTDFGARLAFEVEAPEDARLPIAREDLLEILGPLAENAARHARRRVRISVDAESRALIVEDDGPGIDPASISRAIERGVRLDEAGDGHGLGLSIARELIEATRGTMSLDRSALGGLRVAATWPAA